MPRALVLSAGYATLAAAGNAVATPMAGDTFNVPNFTAGSAYLEQIWAEGADTDWVEIYSPKFHDNNEGVRFVTSGGFVVPLLPWGSNQKLFSGDTPTVKIDETAIATGAVATLYSFDDLPGVQPRLASWADVQPRIQAVSGVEVDLGAIAAIGDYSAGVAINATFDNFQAGSDYALLGYVTAASVLAIAVSGGDTGNTKIGGPGINDPRVTRDFFIELSERTGKPCIPIIAANNKASTLVYQTDNSAHAAQHVTLVMAELG